MPIPTITHLQFLILAGLIDGERAGRDLRALLAQEGHRMSAPSFYQLMSRLEETKFVKGRYQQKLVEGQPIKERVYSISGVGASAVQEAADFYAARRISAFGWQGS
jgi:DNA-binding PadR family transcriptional regulator